MQTNAIRNSFKKLSLGSMKTKLQEANFFQWLSLGHKIGGAKLVQLRREFLKGSVYFWTQGHK